MMASKQKRDTNVNTTTNTSNVNTNVPTSKEKDKTPLQQSSSQQQPSQQMMKDKDKMTKDDNESSNEMAGGSEKVEKDKNTLLYEACVAGDIDYCKSLNPEEVKYEPYVTSASNSVNVNVALCALSKCEDKSKRPAIGQWALENGACFIYTWQHPPSELKKNVDPIKSFGKGHDKH